MKAILLPALIIALPVAGYCQGFQLQVSGGGGLSSVVSDVFLVNRQESKPWYEAGLCLRYKTRAGFTLTTGLDFAQNKYTLGPLVFDDQFDPLTGTVKGEPVFLNYSYQFLRVPIRAGYEHNLSPKFLIGISAGASFNYLLAASRTGKPGHWDRDETSDYERGSIGLSADLSLAYRLSRRISLALLPTYAMNNFNLDDGRRHVRFNTYGLRLGAGFDL